MVQSHTDNSAQISLDYLIGITIFLLTFIFVFAFIPGMFSPFHSNSDEITMAADRVAATLVENVLATGGAGSKEPCILDQASVDAFATSLADPATSSQLRRTLGLNTTDGGQYNLEVVIDEQGMPSRVINNGQVPGMTNVGQSRRYALLRDSAGSGIDLYPGKPAIITVRVW
jgi:hypothetical protein